MSNERDGQNDFGFAVAMVFVILGIGHGSLDKLDTFIAHADVFFGNLFTLILRIGFWVGFMLAESFCILKILLKVINPFYERTESLEMRMAEAEDGIKESKLGIARLFRDSCNDEKRMESVLSHIRKLRAFTNIAEYEKAEEAKKQIAGVQASEENQSFNV